MNKLQKSLVIKQIPSTTLPIFVLELKHDSTVVPTSSDTRKYKMKPKDSLFSPFVEVQASNQRTVLIRKTTAVWLLQECKQVSSDGLFRVRSKQPHTCASECDKFLHSTQRVNGNPCVAFSFSLRVVCIYINHKRRIGRVLHFAKCTDKASEYTQQYKGYSAEISAKNIGVLCTMYDSVPGSTRLLQISQCTLNVYRPLSSCTVKPPKKGRIGDGAFVPCREVVLFSEVLLISAIYCLKIGYYTLYIDSFIGIIEG